MIVFWCCDLSQAELKQKTERQSKEQKSLLASSSSSFLMPEVSDNLNCTRTWGDTRHANLNHKQKLLQELKRCQTERHDSMSPSWINPLVGPGERSSYTPPPKKTLSAVCVLCMHVVCTSLPLNPVTTADYT